MSIHYQQILSRFETREVLDPVHDSGTRFWVFFQIKSKYGKDVNTKYYLSKLKEDYLILYVSESWKSKLKIKDCLKNWEKVLKYNKECKYFLESLLLIEKVCPFLRNCAKSWDSMHKYDKVC